MGHTRLRLRSYGVRVVGIVVLLSGIIPGTVHAQATNAAPAAKVSFTFDDGLASAASQAQPTLTKYGLTGTSYIITGCVGMTQVPNTCRANTSAPYMTWAQVQALQSAGWEIGSHTVDHKCLASNAAADPSDCQKNTLTTAQVDTELSQSQTDLASHGIVATDIAVPYGDYNNSVLAEVAKYYATMRGFQDTDDNVWPYDEYLLNDVPVQETINTVSTVEAQINRAIANKQWLVLTFHDIQPTPSQDPNNYQYGTGELDQIAAYVAAKQSAGQIQSSHVDQGYSTSGDNLLGNGSFTDGVADGWTTDTTAAFTADSGSHGSYPEPLHTLRFASAASGNAHLFSPKVSVDPFTTYLYKSYLNLQSISSGVVGYYVDEYDVNGNWISGQYLKQEDSSFVENMNFTYKPSSAAVAKASLQVIVAGSGIAGYLDSAQLFALSSQTPANLVANGTFDAGISSGWGTDAPNTIVADAQNHGAPTNPVNAVSLTAIGANTHLFSPRVAVNKAHSYSLDSYLNISALTSGVVGYYVDEYDVNGNWISGQYITGDSAHGPGTLSFGYTPSSTNVATASLQIIVMGGSGAHAYFDDVRWYQAN